MLEIPEKLRHIAMIMDGNGRWARGRGFERTRGHKEGIKTVRSVTTALAETPLAQLTLYAMSVENFLKRPKHEVKFLLMLLERFVHQERRTIMENNVRFCTIGRTDEFPDKVQRSLANLAEESASNDGMVLCLALNYGARREIAEAARALAEQAARGEIDPATIDEDAVRRHLYDPDMPDPDLMIRTAGEMRISNFLLWQASYSEIYVTDKTWPDFDLAQLELAIDAYRNRQRKFGGLLERSGT